MKMFGELNVFLMIKLPYMGCETISQLYETTSMAESSSLFAMMAINT